MPIWVRPLIFAKTGKVKEMEMLVKRGPTVKDATIGELSIDGVFECYTLEDVVREPSNRPNRPDLFDEWVGSWKVQNQTAIPRGRYEVTITYSPHFGCDMPLLNGVPGYSAVRIHPGNDAKDTDGCILVGQTKEANLIYKSKAAFQALFPKIKAALAAGPVYVTVQ